MYIQLIAIISVLLYLAYTKLKRNYNYWKTTGVKGPKPHYFIGNMKTILNKEDSLNSLTDRLYNHYPDEQYVGMYEGLTPVLILRDPKLIKNVLIRDFLSFTDRGFKISNDALTRNLFLEDGKYWKVLRQKLTPIFTTGKLKKMMPLLNNCVKEYLTYVNKIVDRAEPQEMRNINMKYTLKVITSVAFGLEIDTFTEERNQFIEMADEMFKPNIKIILAVVLRSFLPEVANKLNLNSLKQHISDFFLQLVGAIIKQREGNPKVRKDFMDLMIELKEEGLLTVNRDNVGKVTDQFEITNEVITAQALLFYAAGFETSSGVMSYLFYELALNPEIQDRCYQEVIQVKAKYEGQLPYEALSDLQYLNMTFEESLRKHPVVGVLRREAVTNYKFENTDLTITKGVKIRIPFYSLQNDPKYFPDPERFDSERFSPENKRDIRDGTYLPFGDGPRNCIGMRFAKVQTMMGAAYFLSRFRVSPCEKTVKKIKHDPRGLTLISIDGLWLTISRRNR